MGSGKSTTALVGLLAGWAMMPASAMGSAIVYTPNLIEVTVTSGGRSASYIQPFGVTGFSDYLDWSLPGVTTLEDQGYALVDLNDLQVTYAADPGVDLAFALKNRTTAPVTVSIRTGTLKVGPIPNPSASASASVTLTQGLGSTPGASISGLFPNGKMYQARYSTSPLTNTAGVFANLTPMATLSGQGSTFVSETLPAIGELTTNGVAWYMLESEFNFTLSAGDQATGTSTFFFTPEPGTALLVLSAGLMLARRKR